MRTGCARATGRWRAGRRLLAVPIATVLIGALALVGYQDIRRPTGVDADDPWSGSQRVVVPLITAEGPSAIIPPVTWESMGGPPGAGRVLQLVQSTSGEHILYANLQGRGIFESRDRGEHWSPLPQRGGTPEMLLEPMAMFGDTLLLCGWQLMAFGADGAIWPVLEGVSCASVSSNGSWVAVGRDGPVGDLGVFWANGIGPGAAWRDISPAPGELAEFGASPVGVREMLVAGDRVFAAFEAEKGTGAFYSRALSGGQWARLPLAAPADVLPSRLGADSADPLHLYATFRHPVLHDVKYPLGQMAFESQDAGLTWSPLATAVPLNTNAVTDVVRVGSARYLVMPYDGENLLGQDGAREWTTLAPLLDDFPGMDSIPGVRVGLERVLVDPSDGRVVYGLAGRAWEFGLVRSSDGMQTWHKMDRDLVASAPTIVAPSPRDPGTLFTASNILQESYVTRDGGTTWEPFSSVSSIDEVRVDPRNANHLIVIDENTTIFESFDGGRTFGRLAEEFSGSKVLDFEIAPAGAPIYASILGFGISRQASEGDWQHMTGSPDYAYDLEIDPDDSRVIYATNSPKLFERHSTLWRYSPDDPLNYGWKEILRVENSAGFTSLRFDPSDSDTLYAALAGPNGTVYVSRDHGATWSVLNPSLTFTSIQGNSQLEVDRRDPDRVYVGTWGGGSFVSADGGETWSALDDDHTFSPTCIVPAPSDPDVVYACDRTAPLVHRSLDGGLSWDVYFDFGPGHMTTTAIAVDPANADAIYAAAFKPPVAMLGSVYRIEAGVMVESIGASLPRAVIELAVDPGDGDTVYAATHLHGLFKSTDGGDSWMQLDDRGTGLPRTGFLDLEVNASNGAVVYAASLCGELPDYVLEPVLGFLGPGFRNIDPAAQCGLYRSTNGGASWTLVRETLGEAKGVAVDPGSPSDVYLADSSGGVWVSNDGGTSWRRENDGLASTTVTAVRVLEGRVYAGTQGSGVVAGLVETDGSITWLSGHSPRAYVYRVQLEIDPSDSDRIYASSYPGGVLRSDDGGETWAAKNFLTPSIRVTDPAFQGYYALEIDPSDPESVWLGVYGRGVIVSRDGRNTGIFANGADGLMSGKHITSVQVDPNDSDRVYVGAEEGVFVSEDGGATWTALNDGFAVADVRSLRLAVPDLVPFAADFDGGTAEGFSLSPGWSVVPYDGGYALRGEGHTWADRWNPAWVAFAFESDIELQRADAGLHVNARVSDEGRYFVGFGPDGLMLSKQFNQWNDFADELGHWWYPIGVGSTHRLRIEVTRDRVRVSLDGVPRIDYVDPDPLPAGGIAFESLGDGAVIVDNVSVQPAAAEVQAYAGTAGYGLYRFDSAADRWQHLGRPVGGGFWVPWERRMYQFSSILFDPAVAGRLYYGHFPGGFYVSSDGGKTWRDSSPGLGNDGIFSLTMHPNDRSVLFAGTYNGVVKSTDGGKTWKASSTGMPGEQWPYTVAIDDRSPAVMYASTKNGMNKGFCERNTFCGVVMKSMDGGATWLPIMKRLDGRSEFYTLLIHPTDHRVLFLSSNRGVFVSGDAGASWQPMNDGLPTTFNQVRDNVAENLAISPDGNWLYLGLSKFGAWRADISAFGGR